MRTSAALGLLLSLFAGGCGPSLSDPPPVGSDGNIPPPRIDGGTPPPPGSLRLEPGSSEFAIELDMPAELDYRAIYTGMDGTDEDVTTEAVFSLADPTFGTFAGAHFTSSTARAGRTLVFAMARGRTAQAALTLRLRTIVIGPGAPPNAATLFGGPDAPANAPALVYPDDGTLVPPNLNELEFHFRPGAGNTLFRLSFEGTLLQLEVYLGCSPLGGGCAYTPDEATWRLLADAERGTAPVTYSLAGVDGGAPGGVGHSASRAISFGEVDIVGGLYYWNAAVGAIRRYDFGRRGQEAENFLDASRAGAMTCVGCHAMSRDGTRIAVGLDIPAPSPYKVFDVATRAQIYAQGSTFGGGANFFSFSPDSTQIMSSNGASIAWRNSTSGAAIIESLVAQGTMPDWSANGAKLVYSRPGVAVPCFGGFCGAPGVDQGSLEVIDFDGASWGPAATIVPYSGQNNYYPAFSPDTAWVMFNRSPSNANSFDAPDAQVWVVGATGGTPIPMSVASTGGDSWPKWAPDVQPYRGGSVMWFTFSSRRAYGLRLPSGMTAQLWMAGFDPQRAAAGEDPSFTAFRLPFQELGSGNHIAQWVTNVERQPCSADGDCPSGEFCEGGICLPVIE